MEFKDFQFEAATFADGRIYAEQGNNASEGELRVHQLTKLHPETYFQSTGIKTTSVIFE